MGVYRRAERRAHGYPLYELLKDGKATHFLYRASVGGCWSGTDAEEDIAEMGSEMTRIEKMRLQAALQALSGTNSPPVHSKASAQILMGVAVQTNARRLRREGKSESMCVKGVFVIEKTQLLHS